MGFWHCWPFGCCLNVDLGSHHSGCLCREGLGSITSCCGTAVPAPTGLLIALGEAQKYPFPRGICRELAGMMLAGLSPLLPCRFKRMAWTNPFQQPPSAKREVPRAEPGCVTLAGQGRAPWSKDAFLWILPKSRSLQHLSPRIFSWGLASSSQDILVESSSPEASSSPGGSPGVWHPHSVIPPGYSLGIHPSGSNIPLKIFSRDFCSPSSSLSRPHCQTTTVGG